MIFFIPGECTRTEFVVELWRLSMPTAPKFILFCAMMTVAAGLMAQNSPAPEKTVAASVNEIWTDVEQSFVALADAMPEDKWNFKPAQGAFTDARTFAEQVKHVACANEAWARKLNGEKPPAHCDVGGPNPAKTKAEIMKYLKESFQMMDSGIAATDAGNQFAPLRGPYGGDNRLAVIEYALWHATDHYGQLVVYLRMNGIVPPASR
jgi:uncharacterized damage-inducible protein DinB